MNKFNTQYIISIIFLAYAAFEAYLNDWWEVVLYVAAGLAFGVMGLIRSGELKQYSKALNVVSWILIGFTLIYFFFLVQTDG